MGFIQPCFIESVDNDVIEHLKELGYTYCQNGYDEWYIPIKHCHYIECGTSKGRAYFMGRVCKPYSCVFDCGTNKDLFFAIAALRDDTDTNQWFTNGKEWMFCPEQTVHSEWGTVYKSLICGNADIKDCNILNYHKASIKELIEHFKKE